MKKHIFKYDIYKNYKLAIINNMKKIRHILPAILVFIDLLIKNWVSKNFHLHKTFKYIPLLSFHPAKNKGIGFSLLANSKIQKYLPIIIGGILLIMVYEWMQLSNQKQQNAWGLIIGGGIANFIDRYQHKYVLDYLKISYCSSSIICNFADLSICAGVAYLLYLMARPIYDKTIK